jgi:nucleoside-diphosphate-sugar epimerase
MRILVTGSAGFICGYVISELLEQGHEVYGVDNFSKYGPIEKSYDRHPRYHFIHGDAKNTDLLKELITDCDHVLAAAALVGGISYFHKFAYDLLAENERITASTFDAAIWAFQKRRLQKITVLSSSMVYESATQFPTPEGSERKGAPPRSTYGFQKLACEYFAQGASEQYGLPFTILRPFNCVGIGERGALRMGSISTAKLQLGMSHAVPDLIQKALRGQDPLPILGSGQQIRHYTYAGDLAVGIRLGLEHPAALNTDFNLSTAASTSVLELAQNIWARVHSDRPFRFISDPPYRYDVATRVPDISKAQRLLGFTASTSLDQILDEMVPWVKAQNDFK